MVELPGEAVTLAPLALFKEAEGDHVKVPAQHAVNVLELPAHILILEELIVGEACTKTVIVLETVAQEFTPTTV